MMVMAMVTARRTIEWLCGVARGPGRAHVYFSTVQHAVVRSDLSSLSTPWFPEQGERSENGKKNANFAVFKSRVFEIPRPSSALRLSPSLSVSLRLSPR